MITNLNGNAVQSSKVFLTDNGDTLVINGKLVVSEDAIVEGLDDGGSSYELPIASVSTLGGVKIGEGISIDSNGVISASDYELPIASVSTLGGVKIGEGISIDSNGVISASGGGSVEEATTTTAGIVKQAAYKANVSPSSLSDISTEINDLLQKLRAAGIMASA